jgi:nitrogen fixation/metabolism regulation signal transduction histidine kinase
MKGRKKYIIDKGFQLRTTFSILGIVAVVSLIIIATISASVVYNNEKINNIYEIEDSIFSLMQAANMESQVNEEYIKTTSLLMERHESNLTTIDQIAQYNRYLLFSLVFFVLVQWVVLFVMLIRITHRISGPVFVMSRYFKEIIDGNIPDIRPLREKDELKNFYALFKELVDTLKKKGDSI